MTNEAYFSIQHQLSVNIERVTPTDLPSSLAALEYEIPIPFKMANDVADIDSSALRSIRGLGDQAEELINYLKLQTTKINLIMSYVLSQQDSEDNRCFTTAFGAGGLTFTSLERFETEQPVRIKLFIPSESSAIYCYGKVTDRGITENDNAMSLYTVQYTHIRDIDREILIRATLHIQQDQLKQKAELRAKNL